MKFGRKKILNSLFLETILRDIEENFNVELNRESIVKLVNTLYYGKFRPITLRTRYDVNESDVLRNNEKDDDDANEWRTFSNYIVSYDPEGKKKSLVVKIQVPEDQTPESFQVRVSHNLISVTNETKKRTLELNNPFFNRKVTKHV